MAREILKTRPVKNSPDQEFILVHLTHNEITPYVTWMRNKRDNATYWGHYFKDLEPALADFNTRQI